MYLWIVSSTFLARRFFISQRLSISLYLCLSVLESLSRSVYNSTVAKRTKSFYTDLHSAHSRAFICRSKSFREFLGFCVLSVLFVFRWYVLANEINFHFVNWIISLFCKLRDKFIKFYTLSHFIYTFAQYLYIKHSRK